LTKIEDDFRKFIKEFRAAEAKKQREEKEAVVDKQLKELVGDDEANP
jgi:hypothetical protein